MKKTLLSLSLALAMTPAAWAADVTVYGVVDVGLSYVPVSYTHLTLPTKA